MIIHPAVIALIAGSLMVSVMLLLSAFFGVSIFRSWDIRSGSELQLNLERKTYLISTLMMYVLWFQLASFFLFIFTADRLHELFVGAMCAAGTLNVNEYGYPALILKMVNFILAGLWLIVNYVDNRAYDYPLIKKKYALLLVITPFVFLEAAIQGLYFAGMKADLITSCCGSQFSSGEGTVASELASLPVIPLKIAFYSSIACTFMSGFIFLWKENSKGVLFSLASGITFLISIAAVISFFSLYLYELPTHHCPFCMLQREYRYLGYVFYLPLLCAAVTGSGVGVLASFRTIESLNDAVPVTQRKLIAVTLISYFLFSAVATYAMISSPLMLKGY
ncbi:MAG: hypothetical protein RDU01_07375 [Thermodesulfovibrionales bacterium]|nr:hypothetical protein [Thermodesulfovibrionales bacterium]